MLYFLDTADASAARKAYIDFPLDGITTNPTILARDLDEGVSLSTRLRELREICAGRLFVQVTSTEREGMVREARAIVETLGGELSVKIPATGEGFAAMKILAAEGISVTATAVYTTSQALLAAKCGADFAAPYISHLDNLSQDGAAVACEMAALMRLHGLKTRVLAASFRTAAQVERCLAGGVPAVTVTAEMLTTLASHPGTASECASFERNWTMRFDRGIGEML